MCFWVEEVSDVDCGEEGVRGWVKKLGGMELGYMSELWDMVEGEVREGVKGGMY